jgi:prolyl oligopeptidase
MSLSTAKRILGSLSVLSVVAAGLATVPRPAQAAAPPGDQSAPLTYPKTRKVDQVDDYHGVKVSDPYRWLEDDKSPETAAWVAGENKVTFAYLNQIPYRAQLQARLRSLLNYPRFGLPVRRGEAFFFKKNDGLQNQAVWYVQKGLEGVPEVLLDPNTLSSDGTTRLGETAISGDGRYFAYGVSTGGSDWEETHVMEVANRKVLSDQLKWVKGSGLGWAKEGFFYSRYPAPQPGHELSGKNEFHTVYFHKVGTPQADDQVAYEDHLHPDRFHRVYTTVDERFAILEIGDPAKKGNALFYRDLSRKKTTFQPIVAELSDDSYGIVNNVDDRFLVQTNHDAPNWRVALYDPAKSTWSDVLPEKPQPLASASTAGGKLFALYSKDVAATAYVYSMEGKLENEIELPGPGTAWGFDGQSDDTSAFYVFTSLNYPETVFRYEIGSRKSSTFRVPRIPGYSPENYETREVFVTSKDGTRIPMFLLYKKGLKLDGANPTLLTGYGGFDITMDPVFDPLNLALLEQGFVFASANLRGGAEYGEKWHEAGIKLRKQNVFDDFIGAAEWLIQNKYTSPEHLAINGTSNGGLLIGAVVNQRPDLFRVAAPQAGVMDMLRFQRFTVGAGWIPEYGSIDNPEEFAALRAYSPLHNVRQGVKYPAVFVTTADHDDRVVSAHSFKYAAALQETATPERPVLIRIETKSGHWASSVGKDIEIMTDLDAFIFYNLGVTPKL